MAKNVPRRRESGMVRIKQETNYPFDEKIRLTLTPEDEQTFTLKLRIPTWARGQFVPGELYDFARTLEESWEVKVNGKTVKVELDQGFAIIQRKWRAGDVVELSLPMPVRFNTSIAEVEANVDRMAVTKGPLVYCAEEVDNAGKVQRFFVDELPDQSSIEVDKMGDGILEDVVGISLPARSNGVGGVKKENVNLIPYYAWNNRGDASMIVWLPTRGDMVE